MTALRFGDSGPLVISWQQQLQKDGFLVTDLQEQFGTSTANATQSWQYDRGLVADGVVGPRTLAAVGTEPIVHVMPAGLPTAVQFVQARHWGDSIPSRKTVDLVVLHCTDGPETPMRAMFVAKNFEAGAKCVSAHYVVDNVEIIQCVHEDRQAWHAPGANSNGIGIEHIGYARQTMADWADSYSAAELHLSTFLTADICRRWAIPAVNVRVEGLLKKARGITTHAEVAKAFGGTHWDPGPGFPLDSYIANVGNLLAGGSI